MTGFLLTEVCYQFLKVFHEILAHTLEKLFSPGSESHQHDAAVGCIMAADNKAFLFKTTQLLSNIASRYLLAARQF